MKNINVNQQQPQLGSSNANTQTTQTVLTVVLTIIVIVSSTLTANTMLGVNIVENILYWVIISLVAIIIITRLMMNKPSPKSLITISVITIVMSFITLLTTLSLKKPVPCPALGPGVYNFRLAPGEITKEKFAIQPDCEYSFSSSTMADPAMQVFFIIYDEKIIKIDRADIPIPPGPGPFKIMAGESGAYVKLLIIKK